MNESHKEQIIKNISESLICSINLFGEILDIIPFFKSNKIQIIEMFMSLNRHSDFGNLDNIASTFISSEETIKEALSLIQKFSDEFQIDMINNTITDHYLILLKNELATDSKNLNLLKNIDRFYKQHMESFRNKTIAPLEHGQFHSILNQIMNSFPILALETINKISQLGTFKHIKDFTENIVIVGANGSGKSSFSRSTKAVLGSNIAIISAQKLFVYSGSTAIPIGSSSLNSVYNFQSNDKLFREESSIHYFNSDLNNLINSLIVDFNECASEFYNNGESSANLERRKSKLIRVFEIWNTIIQHRTLSFNPKTSSIIVNFNEGDGYKFNNLSDGEKAVFYYISHVLQAKESSYIIVDEPENHLHLSIISKLWDILEKERQDCRFIYLTHNLDFATSRINVKKLWNKKFLPPAYWDVQELPTDTELPEVLLMELLGSRKQIIFCEGSKSSLDYKLYNILFVGHNIIPVGGHLNVINYTRSFNRSKQIHGNRAYGIIDGDFHSLDEIESWKKDYIFTIQVQEVENLLCDEILLEAAKEQFLAPDDSVTKSKEKLFHKLSKDIDNQSILFSTLKANNLFMQNMIKNQNSVESLIYEVENLSSILTVKVWFEERQQLLYSIVVEKNYDLGLKHYNNKGLVGILPVNIDKDYVSRIFELLNRSPEIIRKFKDKHFFELKNILEKT